MQTVFSIDPDLQAVAEFMQNNIPAGKLVAVADGMADMRGLQPRDQSGRPGPIPGWGIPQSGTVKIILPS